MSKNLRPADNETDAVLLDFYRQNFRDTRVIVNDPTLDHSQKTDTSCCLALFETLTVALCQRLGFEKYMEYTILEGGINFGTATERLVTLFDQLWEQRKDRPTSTSSWNIHWSCFPYNLDGLGDEMDNFVFRRKLSIFQQLLIDDGNTPEATQPGN